jgi:phosphatidylserine/phosphatidylglycerophosphate/cardiolipin synthase-like enzyme
VLCDRSAAYLGSSNVTAASLEHSMEMGVVLEGRAAASVADVIDAVLESAAPWN